MKKILFSVLAVLCFFAPLSALEWGGLVNEEFKYTKTSDSAMRQGNSAYLWVNAPLTPDASWAFAAEGMYKYTLDIAGGENTLNNIADVDLLKLGGTIKSALGITTIAAGRFTVADNTGTNFSQCCDGVSLNMNMSKVNFGVYAGYTGLLNSLNVSILGQQPEEMHQFYTTCHPYIPFIATFELPSILGNQSLALQGESFLDAGKGDKYNRAYVNVKMAGPITGTIYYTLISSLGFVNKNLMNYSSFAISAYPTSSLAFNVGAEYASGNQGKLKPYTTFSSKTAYNSASSPEMTGCLVPALDCIYTVGSMFANVAVKAPVVLPTEESTTTAFGGVGADVTFIYNIFSDLQAEVDFGYYKDVVTDGADDSLSATVKFAISF